MKEHIPEPTPAADDSHKVVSWLSFRPEKMERLKRAARAKQMAVTGYIRFATDNQLDKDGIA